MAKNPRQSRGFTLLDLLITLTVAAILLSLSVPSFSTAIQNNRMTTQVNELNTALSLARSEAVKRNNNITICQSSTGTSCTGNWKDGWIVFADGNDNGAIDDGEEILLVHEALPGDTSIDFSANRVTYTGAGLATNGASSTFTVCDARGTDHAKALVIGPTGRPSLVTAADDETLSCS
jgi:type IV fimbrial biogenesis protein FimT